MKRLMKVTHFYSPLGEWCIRHEEDIIASALILPLVVYMIVHSILTLSR